MAKKKQANGTQAVQTSEVSRIGFQRLNSEREKTKMDKGSHRQWLAVTAVLALLAVPPLNAQEEETRTMCPMCQSMGMGQGMGQGMEKGMHQGMGQKMGRGMGQGMGQNMGQSQYNAAGEVTVTGTVEAVEEQTGAMGMVGTHLKVKTGEESLDVHLGPSSFLRDRQFSFAVGDEVEIIGSRTAQGGEVLVARQVKRGSETLVLRDALGVPEWDRRGMRGAEGQGKGQGHEGHN